MLHVQALQALTARCVALASSREEHNQIQAQLFADAVARLTKMPKFVLQVNSVVKTLSNPVSSNHVAAAILSH